jgi:hypothetical protein
MFDVIVWRVGHLMISGECFGQSNDRTHTSESSSALLVIQQGRTMLESGKMSRIMQLNAARRTETDLDILLHSSNKIVRQILVRKLSGKLDEFASTDSVPDSKLLPEQADTMPWLSPIRFNEELLQHWPAKTELHHLDLPA